MTAVDVINQAIDAYATGGLEALTRFYHPEAEIIGGPYFGPKGTYTGGPEALRRIATVVDGEYEDFKARPMQVRPGGTEDRVLVEGIVTYGASKGGPGGAWRSWWVINVRDEKIARLEIFHDASEAHRAAGLGEQ